MRIAVWRGLSFQIATTLWVMMFITMSAHGRVRPDRNRVTLEVAHGADLTVTFREGAETAVSNRTLRDNTDGNSFSVSHSTDVEIVVIHANPLLYKYEIVDKTDTKLPSVEALESLATTIQSLAATFQESNTGCEDPDINAYSLLMRQVLTELNQVDKVLRASERFTIDEEGNSRYSPGQEVRLAFDWQVEEHRKNLTRLSPLMIQKAAGTLSTECRSELALPLSLRSDLDAAITRLAQIASLAKQLGRLPLDVIPIGRTTSTSFKVKVSKVQPNWPAGLQSPRFSGERTISLKPYEAVPVGIVPAIVYSFVDNPSFGTTKTGDQFVITQTRVEKTGFDLAGALQFQPRALDFTTFNTVIHLGVAPQKDVGFFLGAGIHVTDLFAFGGGVAFQRTTRLASGLQTGQTLASEDLLKTEKHFRSGPYIFISLRR
jgi:hypothetical protein